MERVHIVSEFRAHNGEKFLCLIFFYNSSRKILRAEAIIPIRHMQKTKMTQGAAKDEVMTNWAIAYAVLVRKKIERNKKARILNFIFGLPFSGYKQPRQ